MCTKPDLVETALAANVFSTLAAALSAAGLLETLKSLSVYELNTTICVSATLPFQMRLLMKKGSTYEVAAFQLVPTLFLKPFAVTAAL